MAELVHVQRGCYWRSKITTAFVGLEELMLGWHKTLDVQAGTSTISLHEY